MAIKEKVILRILLSDTSPPELHVFAKKTTRYRSLVYVKQLVLDIAKAMMIAP